MTADELIEQYRIQSERGQFRGLTVNQYKHSIAKLVQRTDAKTILDYGSGTGEAWKILGPKMRVKVRCYDPAVERFSTKPTVDEKFDGVIICDVLEHIPLELNQSVIDEVFSYARNFVFATVCTRLAKKCFPSGENMHVALRPFGVWRQMFESAAACHHTIEWNLKETP